MNDATHICPLCESGELTEVTYSDVLELRGAEHKVDGLLISVCSHCGEESLSLPQMKANNKIVAAARAALVDAERAQQGLLLGEEILRLRESLGLTQQQAARVFGGGANAFSKYERGEVVQSEIMDRLLRVSAKVAPAADWLIETSGVWEELVRPELRVRDVLSDVFDVVDDNAPKNSWFTVEKLCIVGAHIGDGRRHAQLLPPVPEEVYESDEWPSYPQVSGWR